jgi:hypothetical protein
LNRKDYNQVAGALLAGFARLGEEARTGGSAESLDHAQVRRLLALVTSGMAEWFSSNSHLFNSETFLSACGVLDEVKAMTPKLPRELDELVDCTDVQVGDYLIYTVADGRDRAALVKSLTDLAVTVDAWDMDPAARGIDATLVFFNRDGVPVDREPRSA